MNEHEMVLQQTLVLVQYCPSQVQVTHQNIQGLSSNKFDTLPSPLNRPQKGIYKHNT